MERKVGTYSEENGKAFYLESQKIRRGSWKRYQTPQGDGEKLEALDNKMDEVAMIADQVKDKERIEKLGEKDYEEEEDMDG